jgi:hypothetical protein
VKQWKQDIVDTPLDVTRMHERKILRNDKELE